MKKSPRLFLAPIVLNPVLIIVGILFFAGGRAYAAPVYKPALKQAMTYYTAGVYGPAYDAFRTCLLAEPQNPRYYYYMGNCLLKLGHVEAALTCFRRSVKIGTDTECTIHSMRALEIWVPYLESQNAANKDMGNQANTNIKTASNTAPIKAKADFFGNEPESKVALQVNERRARVLTEKDQALKSAKSNFDKEVLELERKLTQDKKDVPKYIYLDNNRRVANPDYDSTIEALKQEFTNKKMDSQAHYQRRVEELNIHFDGLIANEEAMFSNFKSQMRGAQFANNKLTPVNSGLYVRNYINLSGSDEDEVAPPPLVELTAKAKSLAPTLQNAKAEKNRKGSK